MSTYLLGGQDFLPLLMGGLHFLPPPMNFSPINCSKMHFLYILGFFRPIFWRGTCIFHCVSRASRWLYIWCGCGSIAVFLMNQYLHIFFTRHLILLREASLFLGWGGATPSWNPYNSRESPYWRKRFFTCPFILPKDSEKSTIENFSPPLRDALKIFCPPSRAVEKFLPPPLT